MRLRVSDWSIRFKLQAIILVALTMVLGVIGVWSGMAFQRSHEAQLERDLTGLARVLALNVAPALLFDDADTAQGVIDSVRAQPQIVWIEVYRVGGESFSRAGAELPTIAAADRPRDGGIIRGRFLFAASPIRNGGAEIGHIVLCHDLTELHAHVTRYAIAAGVVSLLGLAAAFLITRILAQRVIEPISSLALLASEIATRGDYTRQAIAVSNDETGALVAAFNRMLDEIHRREQELRNAIDRLQAIARALPDPVFVIDTDGMYHQILTGQTSTGPREHAIIGMHMAEILDKETAQTLLQAIRKSVAEWTTGVVEYQLPGENGTLHYEGHIAPLSRAVEGQPGLAVFVVMNTTERCRLEFDLRQDEKMRAIGQLAGGIAHDFNNQLSIILGFAELLDEEVVNPEHRSHIKRIVDTGHRSAQLIRQLLLFSRKGDYRSESVDIHQLLTDTSALLRHTMGMQIEIALQLRAERYHVQCASALLQNAILNLAINARDAMNGTGRFELSTRCRDVRDPLRLRPDFDLAPGAYLVIEVRDSGSGMSPETLGHLFEPFFTTKPMGKGTGMGLASVYGTVKRIKGAVEVWSQPGEGSCFSLLLPLCAPDTAQPQKNIIPKEQSATRRILIVDDEPMLAEMIMTFLSRRNMVVQVKTNGEDAVRLFQRENGRFDLVILDVMMPGMSGIDVLKAIRQQRPDCPVLLISGYAPSADLSLLLHNQRTLLLQKPCSSVDLVNAIGELLGRD